LAIANPEHAPYGRAAEQAMRSLGVWEAVQPRLLLGENVAQAAQFASSGNADGGIIAYSLALAPALRDRGTFALLPETLHAPLRQRMVLLRRASPAAARLYDYLRSPSSRAILGQYGFVLPED
jgi:molybdate transport system substrate-binding protein